MKKWGFLFLLLCLCLTFIKIEPFFEQKEEIQSDEQYENSNLADRRISENSPKERDYRRTNLSRKSAFGQQ